MRNARPRSKKRMARNPQGTRQRLLKAAFHEIYRTGFRSADLDTILDAAQVTKGALYHHFESKEALGHAVIDELMAPEGREKWQLRMQRGEDPITALIEAFESTSFTPESVNRGCAVNNLALEMSQVDEAFRKRIWELFRDWKAEIAKALRRGQTRGLVRKDVDAGEVAIFICAAYEGYISLAKSSQDAAILRSGIRHMIGYVESLRVPGSHAGGADKVPKGRVFVAP